MATAKKTAETKAEDAPQDVQEPTQEPTEDQAEGQDLQTPPETVQEPDEAKDTKTRGQTFAEAAEKATPADVGYVGTSPERERTGRDDKGLSLQNESIVTGKGPVPDPRRGVDDSEALKA